MRVKDDASVEVTGALKNLRRKFYTYLQPNYLRIVIRVLRNANRYTNLLSLFASARFHACCQWRSQDFGSGGIDFLSQVGLCRGSGAAAPQMVTNFLKNFQRNYWKYQKFKKDFENFDWFFIYHARNFRGFGPENKIFEKTLGSLTENIKFHGNFATIGLNFTYPAMNFRAFWLKINTLRNF